MFVDQIHLVIQSGDGGKGCESFSRRNDKKSVPDGGEGGRGGDVIFRADSNAPPLADFRFKQRQIAESGEHGSSSRKRGRNGKDLVIIVPTGTRIYDRERGFFIRELSRNGEDVVVLPGGRGGSGNSGGREATPGEKGVALDVELQLRIQADVFLVGIPNAGKSSVLNALTRARPKGEHYPFATTSPEIGVYHKSEYEKLTLCDLPSLYGASHEGRGRGNDFLKHLETAKWIFYVLSLESEFAGDLVEQYQILRNQIRLYNPAFLNIPHVIVINKIDLAKTRLETLMKSRVAGEEIPHFWISVQTRQGLEALTEFLNQRIEALSISH